MDFLLLVGMTPTRMPSSLLKISGMFLGHIVVACSNLCIKDLDVGILQIPLNPDQRLNLWNFFLSFFP